MFLRASEFWRMYVYCFGTVSVPRLGTNGHGASYLLGCFFLKTVAVTLPFLNQYYGFKTIFIFIINVWLQFHQKISFALCVHVKSLQDDLATDSTIVQVHEYAYLLTTSQSPTLTVLYSRWLQQLLLIGVLNTSTISAQRNVPIRRQKNLVLCLNLIITQAVETDIDSLCFQK